MWTMKNAIECSVWSGSTLFALNTGISIKHGNNKILTDNPSAGNGSVQILGVEEATLIKRVKHETDFTADYLQEKMSSLEYLFV